MMHGRHDDSAWLRVLAVMMTARLVPAAYADHNAPPVVEDGVKTKYIIREGSKSWRLPCPVDGDPPPLIMWTKDGEPITPAWTRFKQVNADKDLKIKNVALEDAGIYRCQAVNGFGSINLEFTIVVIGKDEVYDYIEDDENFMPPQLSSPTGRPPFWIDSERMNEMTHAPILKPVGSSIKLRCHAAGYPSPDIIWLKNGKIIEDMYGSLTKGKWALHLKELTEPDSGTFTCRVFNIFGSINASFTIKVVESDTSPPEFDKDNPVNSTISEGFTATFQCKVRSSVPPHIQWLKRIEDTSQVKDNSTLFQVHDMHFVVLDEYPTETLSVPNNTYLNRLVIPSVTSRHVGWYICVVTNPVGHMVYRSSYLRVLPAYEQAPVSDQAPLHIMVGIPVALLLLLVVGCAIYFLQKHQQKPANGCRPPPPPYPPPSLPCAQFKASPHQEMHLEPGTEELLTHIPRAKSYKVYHRLDPLSSVPLQNAAAPTAAATERNFYESTPQPYELRYRPEDEFSDSCDSRTTADKIQHYPSLYNFR